MDAPQLSLFWKTSPGSSPPVEGGISALFSTRWESSGRLTSGGECWTHGISESPSDAVECSLSSILEESVATKYSLSPKACAGILRRAERRGKTLPGHLEAALRSAAGVTISTEPEPS